MKKLRFSAFVGTLALLAGWMLAHSVSVIAAGSAPQVRLNVTDAVPRQVEEGTEQAIVRDYAKALQAMDDARAQNRPELLGTMFVGVAKDQIEQAIRDQQSSNVRVRTIDLGHKLQVIFYSQEGSAMQLRDTARVEIQVVDGANVAHSTVVHSEDATVNYVVLMTPAADHWQVRGLQAVARF